VAEEKRVADVLELIYRLCEDGKTRTAMDLLLESIDDAFHDGRFAFVNELLSKVCLDRLSLTLQLALLALASSIVVAGPGFRRNPIRDPLRDVMEPSFRTHTPRARKGRYNGLSPVGPIPADRPHAPACFSGSPGRCRFWRCNPTPAPAVHVTPTSDQHATGPARNSASIVARSLAAQARQSARSLAQSTTCTCSEAIARTHRHDQDRPDSITRPAGAVQASGPSFLAALCLFFPCR
jgi:hypothetical protein